VSPDPATTVDGVEMGEGTRAVHPPPAPVPEQEPLGLAVHRSAAFRFRNAQEYADLLAGTVPGYSYSRIDNPTCDALALAIAALEDPSGTARCEVFASGMAAITAVVLGLGRAGGHVVAPVELYGGTYGLLSGLLERWGVSVSYVDQRDLEAVRAALRPGQTFLVLAEILANPTMTVADVPALSALAHAAGLPLVVDATFASPVVCRPLALGADLVVHSATKYLGGHADATAGAVVGRAELLAPVRLVRITTGSTLSPDEAFLVHRGLATLPLRVRRACESATWLAQRLVLHPGVARVDHPSLPGRDRVLAERDFAPGLFGAVLTITPPGGREAGMAFADGLRLARNATSLGGVHSKVSHAASTTHRQLDEEALLAARIDPGAVRLSVGLEDREDLLADLCQALEGVQVR
jgi:cystathionine beta-lyase/cystathionine gamma-synthase